MQLFTRLRASQNEAQSQGVSMAAAGAAGASQATTVVPGSVFVEGGDGDFVAATLHATDLVITHTRRLELVKGTNDADDGRDHIVVSGDLAAGKIESQSDVTLHYHHGQLHAFSTMTPRVELPSAGDYVRDVLNQKQEDKPYEQLGMKLEDVKFVLSSHQHADTELGSVFEPGLSITGRAPAASSVFLAPFLDADSALKAERVSSSSSSRFNTMSRPRADSIKVEGQVSPVLNMTSQADATVQLGKYVSLRNLTVKITGSSKAVDAWADLYVSPPDAEHPLVIALKGHAEYGPDGKSPKSIAFSGAQVGSWDLPGAKVQGLVLSQATASISLTYTPKGDGSSGQSTVTAKGSIGAALAWNNKLKGALNIAVPAPNMDNGFAVEAWLTDLPHNALASVPGVPQAFPSSGLTTVDAAIVFSSYAGEYTFQKTNDFATSIPVVKGFNFLVDLDFAQSSALAVPHSLASTSVAKLAFSGSVSEAHPPVFVLKTQLTNLVLDELHGGKDLSIPTATLTLQSVTPYVALDAQVTVSPGVFGSSDQGLHAQLTGQVTSTEMDLAGDITDTWNVPVADSSFIMADAKFNLKHAISPQRSTSGSVTAMIKLSESRSVLVEALYPESNDHSCWEFVAEVEDTPDQQTALNHVIRRVLPHTDVAKGLGNVPDQVLQQVLNNTLSDIRFSFAPHCDNFTLSAVVNTHVFGSVQVGFNVHKVCDSANQKNCDWKWHVFVRPQPSWMFSQSSLWPKRFPTLEINQPTFVMSSADDQISFTFPAHDSVPEQYVKISTQQGFNLDAQLDLGKSKDIGVIKALAAPSGAKMLDLSGHFGKDGWSLSIALENDKIKLHKNVYLADPSVSLSETNGPDKKHDYDFQIAASLIVPCPMHECVTVANDAAESSSSSPPASGTKLTSLSFDVKGTFEPGKEFTLSGAEQAGVALAFPLSSHGVTAKTLKLSALKVDLSVQEDTGASSSLTAVTGDISGDLSVGRSYVDLSIALLQGEQVKFTGTLAEKPPLTLGELIDDITHDGFKKLQLPSSLKSKLATLWEFDSLTLELDLNPFALSAKGAMALFNAKVPLNVALNINEPAQGSPSSQDGLQWMFAVELGVGQVFSDMMPGVKSLDSMPMSQLSVAVSSEVRQVTFPGLQGSLDVHPGLNFFASMGFGKTKWGSGVKKLTGMDEVQLHAVIEKDLDFTIHADLRGNMTLLHVFDLTAAGFFVRVRDDDAQIGIETDFNVKLSHRATDRLYFHDDVYVGVQGFGFDAAMTKPWVDPFGVHGVTVSSTALGLELDWDFAPVHVALKGGLHVGGVGGDAAVWISEKGNMLYAELDQIHLQQIVDSMLADVGVSTPPHLVQVVTDVGFNKLKLYANTADKPLVFADTTYQPGVDFEIDQLDLWEVIRGSASLRIGSAGFALKSDLQPINLLDGAIVLSGAKSKKSPAVLDFSMSKSHGSTVTSANGLPVSFNISGAVDFLDEYVAAQAVLADSGWELYLDMSLFHDLFDFYLDCKSVGSLTKPSDFSVKAELNNRLQDYIATEVPKHIKESKSEADARFNAKTAELKEHASKLDAINKKIAAYKAADHRKLSKAEAKVDAARQKVQYAENRVNGLQNKINDLHHKIHHLKWHDKWKAVGYEAEIAGLEIAKHAADGVLDVAKEALKLASEAVEHLPAADPRVLALEAEHGTLEAAYKACEIVVEGAKDVVNTLDNMLAAVAKAQGKVFNIEEMDLSGALSRMAKGDAARVHLKGVFLGRHVDVALDFDLKDLEGYVGDLWHSIMSMFHHKH
eukprot:TRINITY_DN67924_c9_g1_i1.p1 TRINITY_DN67924_c9_g1~~TRINITY_DN67924_c9_g1_i1.p1  ORF type:complete len:1896 (-),score=1148.81 TRINITY_DN67924_c9_g1_i1:3455-8785(-)